jgi:ribosomal protein S15P/S13E
MKFQKVTVTHGPLEFGRDIVFMEVDQIGRQIWRGIQAKIDSITGSLSGDTGLRGIATQCDAALDTPYVDDSGISHSLQEVWIVTPHPVSEQAKASVNGFLRTHRNIHILDGGTLFDLIRRYLPALMESGSAPIMEYLGSLLELCDSPEDYLAAKFEANYRISDIYISPTAGIDYLPLDNVVELPSLLCALHFDFHSARIIRSLPLQHARLLPAIEVHQTREFLAMLRSLAAAAVSQTLQYSEAPMFVQDVTQLCELLGFDASVGSLSYNASSLMSPKLVEENEDTLAAMTHPATEVLRRFKEATKNLNSREPARRTIQRNTNLGVYYDGDQKNEFEKRYGKIKLGREQLFQQVSNAYCVSISEQDSMFPLVKLIADVLLDQHTAKRGPTALHASSVSLLLGQINLYVAHFDQHIRDSYRRSWELCLPDVNFAHDLPFSLAKLEHLNELSQLSALLGERYSEVFGSVRTIPFDAVELAKASVGTLFLGDLGIGKTTLLKRVGALMAANAQTDPNASIPVFIRLASMPEKAPVSATTFASIAEILPAKSCIMDNRLMWLLDGLDEMQASGLKHPVLEWAGNLGNSARVLVTSRSSAVPAYVPGLLRARIEPLLPRQIRDFIQQFPWADRSVGDRLCSVIFENDDLGRLAQTPLLLTLLIILCQYAPPDQLPRRREATYQMILDLFLGGWDAAKKLRRQRAINDNSVSLAILRKAAFVFYNEQQRTFTMEQFIDLCASEYRRFGETEPEWRVYFDDLVSDCLIVPMINNRYAFFHFSIHEYLVALELSNEIGTTKAFMAIDKFFRSNGWWEEVLVFYAAIKRDVTPLIESLHLHLTAKMVREGNSNSLVRLLRRWFEVADLTPIHELNPRGTVASELSHMVTGEDAQRFHALGIIK